MSVIQSDRIVFFDVDDTLILWKKIDKNLPTVTINGRVFQVHIKHIEKINNYHIMGFKIFVWSNSGYKWAETVTKVLGIFDKVTAMSKPHRVFDDVKDLKDTIIHGYIKID